VEPPALGGDDAIGVSRDASRQDRHGFGCPGIDDSLLGCPEIYVERTQSLKPQPAISANKILLRDDILGSIRLPIR
jgi:hypothetical protein